MAARKRWVVVGQFSNSAAYVDARADAGADESSSPVLRTYRQIAGILKERGIAAISPERVRQICRAAEMKIVHALVDEPVRQHFASLFAGQTGSSSDSSDTRAMCRQESDELVYAVLNDMKVGARLGSGSRRGRTTPRYRKTVPRRVST